MPDTTHHLLDRRAAADYLAIGVPTLDKLRLNGGGPRYIKYARTVRYRRAALDEYLAAHERVSTSDNGGGK
jgi:predicted DNA-binding transcriptional regulator AlpA